MNTDESPALRWCDNHCHLDDDRLGVDALRRARAVGVERILTIGTDAARSAAALAFAEAHDGVWATVGLHPHDAIAGVDTLAPLLADGARSPRLVAIGECGLDYFYDHSPRDVQRRAFAAQVALAHALDLALVIHTRDAWDDTFAVLASEGVPPRTVFHCFSGGPAEAEACLALGAFLSFSGIVSFRTADDLRAAAASCPLDRVLVETDAPYLAPVPYRGRMNEPAYLPAVGAALAAAMGVGVAELAEATWRNAAVAFALEPPVG
jgi:TatD DNase family protein